MGNRVKGRVKKKSIKAALSSSAGSKRKLSRMGKKQKKEHAGLEASFIGRSKCLKMLQITLKDFRRLCILKGIYPREPLGRVPGNKKGQTFYHIKDIRSIAHEPILEKFRDFRAFMKKVRRAAGRNELDEAARKNALMPTYTLHHLVKERYPRFVDALSDLDDALTLSYLFAALPGEGDIKPSVTNKAKALVASWGAYCATTCSITKSFISVKGVYLEASIHGVGIRWIIPHSYTQFLPQDVDYRVMMTFLEFYETLLNFVMFKLYNDIGLRYPFTAGELGTEATVGSTSTILAANLKALRRALDSPSGAIGNVVSELVEKERAQQAVSLSSSNNPPAKQPKSDDRVETKKKQMQAVSAALKTLDESDCDHDDDDDDDSVDVAGPLQAALENMAQEEEHRASGGLARHDLLDEDGLRRRRLFAGLTFYFSREIPRGYLELVCLAYGGKVGWEGGDDATTSTTSSSSSSPIAMNDPSITHHVVDRPRLPASYETLLPKSREYIQPQWIVDCANFMFLLPIHKYAVGATLPPHLSPWVDDEEEGYTPAYAAEIERLKNGEVAEEEDDDNNNNNNKDDQGEMDCKTQVVKTEAEAGKDESDEGKEDSLNAVQGESINEEEQASSEEELSEDEDEQEEETESERQKKEKKRKAEEEDEAHALAKSMMNRKASHLYGRMMHGKSLKQAKIDALHQRRKEIEGSKEKNAGGKTVLKQKVERLKQERKAIEQSYDNPEGSSMKKKHKKSKR